MLKRKVCSAEKIIKLCPQCGRELVGLKGKWGECPTHGVLESTKRVILMPKGK